MLFFVHVFHVVPLFNVLDYSVDHGDDSGTDFWQFHGHGLVHGGHHFRQHFDHAVGLFVVLAADDCGEFSQEWLPNHFDDLELLLLLWAVQHHVLDCLNGVVSDLPRVFVDEKL